MLVTWPSPNDLSRISFGKMYDDYNIIVAKNRMNNKLLGAVFFSRYKNSITDIEVFEENNTDKIKQVLEKCAKNQLDPQGGSFHYKYREHVLQSDQRNCPCCNTKPMPADQIDIAELTNSWVNTSYIAQGCLFGKSCVIYKKHYNNLFDMAESDLLEFMKDIQKAAKALQVVTECIKVNYEIHCNSSPHLHCHLFPRYLDDLFPSPAIDYRIVEPSPYENRNEFEWFVDNYQRELSKTSEM